MKINHQCCKNRKVVIEISKQLSSHAFFTIYFFMDLFFAWFVLIRRGGGGGGPHQ